jgi:hypothetical protein
LYLVLVLVVARLGVILLLLLQLMVLLMMVLISLYAALIRCVLDPIETFLQLLLAEHIVRATFLLILWFMLPS